MAAARYWRLVGIDTYAGGDLELSELHLYGASGRLDATTALTSTINPTLGTLAALQDANTTTTCRFTGAAVSAGGFAFVWDFGAGNTADAIGVRLGAATDQATFMAACSLQYSVDGVQWQPLADFARYAWPGVGAYTNAPAVSDSDYSKVLLLLHGDGANGSTVFTDSSATPKTVTSVGGIAISTAQSKFGGSSVYAPGTAGVYLDVSTPNIFDFANGDFTIETWVNASAVASDGYLWTSGAYGTSYGMCGGVHSNGTNVLISLLRLNPYAGTVCSYAAANSLLAESWHHVAWVRTSGVAYIYVDGVQVASAAFADTLSPAVRFRVGTMNHYGGPDDFSYNYAYKGWFDEFRVTKGLARYTSNFTPPTAPFPGSAGVGGTVFVSPTLHTSRRAVQIAASSPVPAFSTRRAPNLQLARDVEHGGPGTIYGTTKTKGTPHLPTKARVVLLHQRSKLPVRETWSDPITGYYEFRGINPTYDYIVLAEDGAGLYRPVAANHLVPEVTA